MDDLRRRWLEESGVCPVSAETLLAREGGAPSAAKREAPSAPRRKQAPVAPAPAVAEPARSDARHATPAVGAESLAALREQALACRACALAEGRTKVVFGTGCEQPDLVFIGEAPGRDEDVQGEPFVGRAGKLLDRMMAAIGLDRRSVYIMNTVKCRPPGNRDPKPEEIAACRRWFDAQLAALSPKVVCLLGRVAAQSVLETDAPLGALRGRWHDLGGIRVRVTYHPAYLLRSPQQKGRSWEDLLALARALREVQAASSSG